VEWYKKLNIHQRIYLKDSCEIIVGVSFVNLRSLFSLKEIIELLYNKLKLEGIVSNVV
jgi:hypothetical protein